MAVIVSIAVVAVLSVGFASNPLDSPTERAKLLQKVTGATNKQMGIIEYWITEEGHITYERVSVSNNPALEGMDTNWKAFDLTDGNGNTYMLILRKLDNDFTALLDSKGRLICGSIDNGVTPALFEDGKYSNGYNDNTSLFENSENGVFSIQNADYKENDLLLSSMYYNNAGLNRNEWIEWNELYRYRTPGTLVSMQFELDGSNIFKFESEKNGLVAEMDSLPQENIQTVSSGERVRGIRSGNCFFLNRDDLKRIGFHINIDRNTWIPDEELV